MRFVNSADLKKWRERHKFSQHRLAEALGVSSNTVSRWELGSRQIPSFLATAKVKGFEIRPQVWLERDRQKDRYLAEFAKESGEI